jgi:2-phosphoglycerate kinase
MPDRQEPRVRGRGHPLPFSKGRMATTLFLSGVEAEYAYQLALEIEETVLEVGASEISLDDLHRIVEGVLDGRDGPAGVARYRAWQAVLRRERPVIVIIGGATGTGKSTLATELAYRLGISRIPSTDVVRQVMRAFFSPALMPSLHYSSFEAGGGMKMPMPDPIRATGRCTASSSRPSRWRWARWRSSRGRCWKGSRPWSRACTLCPAWSSRLPATTRRSST